MFEFPTCLFSYFKRMKSNFYLHVLGEFHADNFKKLVIRVFLVFTVIILIGFDQDTNFGSKIKGIKIELT